MQIITSAILLSALFMSHKKCDNIIFKEDVEVEVNTIKQGHRKLIKCGRAKYNKARKLGAPSLQFPFVRLKNWVRNCAQVS